MNKIPKTFKLNGKTFRVEYTDNLICQPDSDEETDVGQAVFLTDNCIKLANNFGEMGKITPEAQLQVFYHELMHVFLNEIHYVGWNSEDIMELVVQGLGNLLNEYERTREY
jgi:hypothetical protein